MFKIRCNRPDCNNKAVRSYTHIADLENSFIIYTCEFHGDLLEYIDSPLITIKRNSLFFMFPFTGT